MEQIGGVVFRQTRTVVKTTQNHRDAAAHQAEMEQIKAERQIEREDRLARIEAAIDQFLRKVENAVGRKRARIRARQQQREARIEALQAKANQAETENRRRQRYRIAALRHDYVEKTGQD
jgi:Skp family chaperone for outer membrane proteins